MKVSEQSHVSLSGALPLIQTPGTSSMGQVMHTPHVEPEANDRKRAAAEYPMASDEEVHMRNSRSPKFGIKPNAGKKPGSNPGAPKGPEYKPDALRYPNHKPDSARPVGPGAAIGRQQKIAGLHKKNLFPPLSTQLAASARSSLINNGVGALINLPFSVGEHLASKALVDRIDAHSRMPGTQVRNPDGSTTTVDPSATEKQKLEARLEGAEINTETLVNTILSINEGPDAKAVGQSPNAPADASGRLSSLEKRMDAIEQQMQEIAKRYGLVYSPFAGPSAALDEKSRMEVIEQRYKHMNTMIKKLVAAKEIDSEAE
ncbi:MAG: hypothetical protein GAK32_00582 [Pseudomonas fluorescens]|nr:MAG: hypothetical protein GAK32_00582 [Pseudomonas fluorescens]